jgi:tripartite-type tricarboxylate transporter receptor subunit TctC
MGKLRTLAVAGLLGLASTGMAAAQGYPARPIIVPFPAGGATGTLARFLSEQMRTILGQPVVVENVGRAVCSAADG